MRLRIEDWIFEVDVTASMLHSAEETADHCTCGYCRNYYRAIEREYASLRNFLAQFGLNMEAPDVLVPFEAGSGIIYDCCYSVVGKILKTGKANVCVEGLQIVISSENNWNICHQDMQPHFYLVISAVCLPWLLDEPMQGVNSPAGRNSILDKLRLDLLRNTECS